MNPSYFDVNILGVPWCQKMGRFSPGVLQHQRRRYASGPPARELRVDLIVFHTGTNMVGFPDLC